MSSYGIGPGLAHGVEMGGKFIMAGLQAKLKNDRFVAQMGWNGLEELPVSASPETPTTDQGVTQLLREPQGPLISSPPVVNVPSTQPAPSPGGMLTPQLRRYGGPPQLNMMPSSSPSPAQALSLQPGINRFGGRTAPGRIFRQR